MENKLFEAAVEGSIISLMDLLHDDPLILDRFMVSCNYTETPLHIASMLGHSLFVNQILIRKPEMASELDSKKQSSLHLASTRGYVEVVKSLLEVNPDMCLTRNQDGRTPLHVAAIKGRLTVIREIIHAKPEAIRVLTNIGETVLHLCAIHGQFESLKIFMEVLGDESELINHKNEDGNTVLHLAVIHKQIQVANFLIVNNIIDVNARNVDGFTSLNILYKQSDQSGYKNIIKLLKRMGGKQAKSANKYRQEDLVSKQEWIEQKHTSLMVVASLIATMAFQVAVTPPGGVWPDNYLPSSTFPMPRMAGESVAAYNNQTGYSFFITLNTIGFGSSISIILLLISGLPLKKRFFVWILIVITWVAVMCMAVAYLVAIIMVTPKYTQDTPIKIAVSTISIIWVGVMILLLVTHSIRLIRKTIKGIVRLVIPIKKNITTTDVDHILVVGN